jgi:anti-sigma regulatory factor (Ser/Thr protein kinase)
VRTLMDEVSYARQDGRNVMFIRKATGAAAH